jgi:uncharacterized protein
VDRPPVPLSQFVLKVHSRCDLACDHCYVYESADQSWRGRPLAMSEEVISQVARRIAEHAASHRLGSVQVVLHGGEPLLAGRARLGQIATELRSALRGICRLDLRIHTNGVLLDEGVCELFAEHDVRVGISIDGGRAANDRHRRYADGRSSYDEVIRAVGLLRSSRFRHLYAGLLCTIDIANDPVAVYDALMELDPPRIDFLLPHATWESPPPRTPGAEAGYADWLIVIFDRWLGAGRPAGVRTFESIISTLTGGDSLTEALGLAPAALVVIETDGTYEQVDSLKTAFDGAPATGLNVFDHMLDIVARHPGISARQQGLSGLCQTCQKCPVVTSCGGGLYPHRYRAGTGFANPSVYCADLLKLITHISARLPQIRAGQREAPTHGMSGADFGALAAGFGGSTAVTRLIEAQRTLRRVLLSAVYQAGSTAAAVPDAPGAALRAAWAVLTTIDTEQPEALDAVLAHPYVRVWAVRCLEQLKAAPAAGGRAQGTPGLAADLGHLGAIAAVAAMLAKADASVTIPVVNGAVHLPTLGRLVTGGSGAAGRGAGLGGAAGPVSAGLGEAAVSVAGDAVTIVAGGSRWELATAALLAGEPGSAAVQEDEGPGDWQPVRRLRAPGISVALEDTDPYRDCHQWRAARRLTDDEFARWQGSFGAAWQEIRRHHLAHAPALATGLSVLMPLSDGPPGREISATARHAFGAVAAALPADPVTLALLLLHEFQHVKLGAVLDLYDLYDPADRRLFHVPWREDPRPLEGLLQGTYAHLAVTAFWGARREVAAGAGAEAAAERFAYWRDHTRAAIETLSRSGSLTPLGEQFVDEMRHSICS